MEGIERYRALVKIASDQEGHTRPREEYYRNKALGTRLIVGRADDMRLDPEGGPWCCVCETHGAILNTRTKALAKSAARYPDFCAECGALLETQARWYHEMMHARER